MARGDLRTGLIEYWPLQEASGSRVGIHAGISLTDNNTVTQSTGPGGSLASAALLNRANDEFLSNSSVTIGSLEWSLSAWMYVDGYAHPSTGNREVAIYLSENSPGTKQVHLRLVESVGDLYPQFSAFGGDSYSPVSVAEGWHSVVATIGDDNDGYVRMAIFVDGQKGDEVRVTGDVLTSALMRLGADLGTDFKWDGRLAGVGLWSRALNQEEAADIYAAGTVLSYPWYNGPQTFRRTSGLR